MAFDKNLFSDIIKEFTVDSDELAEIAADFRYDLKKGLKNDSEPSLHMLKFGGISLSESKVNWGADGGKSSLRMLKSYVGLPTGNEKGDYLALDFGGTNVRVLRYRLEGNGKFTELKKVAKPLKVEGIYDFIGEGSTAEDMFDFIAGLVDEAVEGDHSTKYLLGHTFSFPSTQTNLYNARLIIWTKEFATKGVEGEIVNDLLKAALERQGLTNVTPTAVINDTVAVLLAAAYKQPDIYIGSIYATGHNTCYLEPYADSAAEPMILNLESGGFSKLAPNRFDVEFDLSSEKPGEQRLEKMVSGRYMGELFGMALAELLSEKGKKYGFTSIDMSNIILDDSKDLAKIKEIVQAKAEKVLDTADAAKVKELASAIVIRSARLVTASYVGIIWQTAGSDKIKPQHIAIDGSVYEKMPLAKENIMRALSELLKEDAASVDTVLENGGSGLGAAIAAAMSQK